MKLLKLRDLESEKVLEGKTHKLAFLPGSMQFFTLDSCYEQNHFPFYTSLLKHKKSFVTIRSLNDCSLYLRSLSALASGRTRTLNVYLLGKQSGQIHNGMWHNVCLVCWNDHVWKKFLIENITRKSHNPSNFKPMWISK